LKTFKSFEEDLYVVNDQNWEDIALQLFRYQVENNKVYRDFASRLGRTVARSPDEIPFLPISFFKTQEVRTGEWVPEVTFTSSGTSGQRVSRHSVKDLQWYLRHTERIFNHYFGRLEDYHVIALLPSYQEREGSSLVAMADYLIRKSKSAESGFYKNTHPNLVTCLEKLQKSGKKVLLLGVTFALMDLAEYSPMDLSHCLIMETGGMKGRRKELTRLELHRFLCSRFNVPRIASEYGMTELLSQAYSLEGGRFLPPPGLRILIRDINDPFDRVPAGKTGAINLIDLANIHSCAFIETEDLGKIRQDGSFEVLGRMDNSDVRGCNLLAE
jgi:hypothetical protein